LGLSKGVVTATFKEHDVNKKILEAAVDQYEELEKNYCLRSEGIGEEFDYE
jgi:hypothetical protein